MFILDDNETPTVVNETNETAALSVETWGVVTFKTSILKSASMQHIVCHGY